MNEKIYIHEFVRIRGQARAKYMHHMTANWGPIGRRERDQLCYGVWGTVGSTGRWPEVVNMWEEDGWEGLAESFAHETGHPGLQDPSLARWWAQAAEFREGGFDRILVPAPWTRTIDQLVEAGLKPAFVAHEVVQTTPERAPEYLELVRTLGADTYGSLGLELMGAFRTAMRNDSECIVLWAVPDHATWARFEAAQCRREEPHHSRWHDAIRGVAADWQRTLLVDGPTSPLRLGRQPDESDRRPLDEIP